MDKELFGRGSTRCIDVTAMQALRNIERNEVKGMDKTGELWKIEMANGILREAAVVKDNGESCVVLLLTDVFAGSCDVEINCRGRMYTSSKRLQYCFADKMVEFIRKLTEAEYAEIMKKVAAAVGVSMEVPKQPVQKETASAASVMELERIKAQLEVYKDLYNNLLISSLKGEI